MSIIQITRQTSLSGRPLQNAVNAMIQQMRGMSPYSMLNVQSSWENGSRLTIRAGSHMTGAVDLRSGPPSTVTAQINLLSSLAEGQRSRVESDMLRLANQHLPLPAGASPDSPTTAPPPAPEGSPEAAQQQQSGFNWNMFGHVVSGLFGSASTIMGAYNQVGQEAAGEAISVAQQEAGKQPSPIGPNTGVQSGPGFTLGQGKSVGPNAPLPGGRLPSDVPAEEGATDLVDNVENVGVPTWVWWAMGISGVVGASALAIYVLTRDDDDFERNTDHERERIYKKMKKAARGPRGRKHKKYTRSDLRREVEALRREGLSVSEISDMLSISRQSVKSFLRMSSRMSGNYGFRYFL